MKCWPNIPNCSVFLFIFFGILTTAVHVCYADARIGKLQSVSIKEATSTNQPPRAVINSRILSESPYRVELDASGSSDTDNAIVKYLWSIGEDTTLTGQVVNYEFTTAYSVNVALKVTDEDGAVTIVQSTITRPWEKWVNFQPANAAVPPGFAMDSGTVYDATRGYGWVMPPRSADATADRDNKLSVDQSYDTLIIYVPTSRWEINVPNGQYTISVCVGDPTYPQGNQFVQVEEQPLIAGLLLNDQNRWIERSANVTVADGRLTLSFTGDYTRGMINWVKIKLQ